MRSEALRRLREEIDAAFEAQRQFKTKRRKYVRNGTTLTPKWAEVTAILASVGDPVPEKATSVRVAKPVKPVSRQHKGIRQQQMTKKEVHSLLHHVMEEWHRIASKAANTEKLFIRAQRWREQRVLTTTFILWRQMSIYHSALHAAAREVRVRVQFIALHVSWMRWAFTHRQAVKKKDFYHKRRARICCKSFCSWVQRTEKRTQLRIYEKKAVRRLVGRYWRWFLAAIKVQRMVRFAVEQFMRLQILKQKERFFQNWTESIEQRKRWQFAARWSERRSLGDAFDCWRDLIYDIKRMRRVLQRATRRQCRCKLQRTITRWSVYVQRARSQKQRLAFVLCMLQRRRAFTKLKVQIYFARKRDKQLLDWKIRRALWTWFQRSYRDRTLRLRVNFLNEKHERWILRTTAWQPWRQNFQRSVKFRSFHSKQQARRVRECWMAFVSVIDYIKELQTLVGTLKDMREKRKAQLAIDVWQTRVKVWHENKTTVAKCAAFAKRKILVKTIKSWKRARYIANRDNVMNATAMKHLTSKMLRHWAKWAFWSRRELGKRIALVRERSRQRRMEWCVAQWKEAVYDGHRKLCSKRFNAWKVAIAMHHRQNHLKELRYLVQLRWRWQRWKVKVLQCQDLRAKACKVRTLSEKRVLYCSLVIVWLCKTRRYALGASKVAAVANQHAIMCAFGQWRERQQRSKAAQVACDFKRHRLQTRHFQVLFEQTIGHKRTAVAYDRHRRLFQSVNGWKKFSTGQTRQREAKICFWRRRMQQAVHSLHTNAANSIVSRTQCLEADSWYDQALLRSVFSNWFATVQQMLFYQSIQQRVAWKVLACRAFRVWRETWLEKQKLVKAAEFHALALLTRSWHELVRVTKRRQVALAMWCYTMTRMRLQLTFDHWNHFATLRRGQDAIAASLYRMQAQRTMQRFLVAWQLLATSCKMASQREQRELRQWRHICWHQWKMWRLSCRWQRCREHQLINKVFSRGIKRYALRQQVCREICMHSAQSLLHRSLAQWRLEWWILCSQQKLQEDSKRNVLTHWKSFVVACRQKRRWPHFSRQLHRAQTYATTQSQRPGVTFRESRALQAQLKRTRILMIHVLHAWRIVVKTRRRKLIAMSNSKKPRSSRERAW